VNQILGYAYILTNPFVGIPCIYWSDYRSVANPTYHTELNQLMRLHHDFIKGAQHVDYLSRFSTPYTFNFSSGGAGTTLIYQLAEMQNTCENDRDVVVAINFSGEPLKVDFTLNTGAPYHLQPGDTLTDLLGRSTFEYAIVGSNSSLYIELPARSYSVWSRVSPVEGPGIAAGGATSFCKGESVLLTASPVKNCYTVQWRRNGTDIAGATGENYLVTETGSYSVVVGYGLAALKESNVIEVNVSPVTPDVYLNANTLTCTVSGVSYQWFGGSNPSNLLAIAGATAQSYDPPNGNYYAVEITDGDGCSDVSQPVLFFPVGVEETPAAQLISLFPNPVSDELMVQVPRGLLKMELFNEWGQEEKNIPLVKSLEGPWRMDFSRFAAGVYFIRFYLGNEIVIKKVVKD
jgi:hypothetical protein